MRVVIDGAAGSGKTTFLSNNYLSKFIKKEYENLPSIVSRGYTVFSELVQGSINEAKAMNISPPQNDDEWKKLFDIMLAKGIQQYRAGDGSDIYWYDRGIPFISAFATAHNVVLPLDMREKFELYRYDYIFIFKPIDSYDLSMTSNGKYKPLTLEDRYEEYERTCCIYESLGYDVHRVPVYSDNLIDNFNRRLNYIKEIIPDV